MNVCTNGVIELVPFMHSLVTEDAFFSGGDFLQNPVVHVLAKDGVIYRYNQFSLGRSSLQKVADTPIKTGPSLLKPYLKPLVDDQKIPVQMLHDILEFFKKVMTMIGTGGRHGEYEAMAHIVWNKTTKSYRVAIPTQKVAKATVAYDWSHVAEDEEVILDIHSHNTMSAFYSGTDEADDKTYAGVSGVAGQLDKANPQVIWRFNAYKDKIPNLDTSDFFAVPEATVSPEVEDWMKKVEVRTYVAPLNYRNPNAATTKVFGGGSRPGAGSNKSLGFNQVEEDELNWADRFQGAGESEGSAGIGASRSQALDYLDRDFHDSNVLGLAQLGSNPDQSWDETVDELVNSVYAEEDDEMNAEVAKRLAESIVDDEVAYQAGVFVVTTNSDARKAVERLQKDFDIRSA